MSWGKTSTLSAVAAILIVGLSGCSAGSDTIRAFARGDESESKPTATESSLEGDLNGDGELTQFETDWLAKTKAEAAVRDYALEDGTIVSVDPSQPLPEAVTADIAGRFAEDIAVAKSTSNGGVRLPLREAMTVKIDSLAESTGVPLMIVYPSASTIEGSGSGTETVWTSMNSSPDSDEHFSGPMYMADREAYIAEATKRAGDLFEVIVLG